MLSLLVQLVIFAAVIGVLCYVIRLIPLPPPFQQIALIVVGLVALIWLLQLLVGIPGLEYGHGPYLR